jgi:hypothetical protein
MISNDLRADVIAELRFIETNLRQMAQVLDELERPSKSTLESMSGACEGWAERITRLLARFEQPEPPAPIPFRRPAPSSILIYSRSWNYRLIMR